MMRTALGWSFSVVMVLGAVVACGSESTNDKGNGTAGNGTVLAGGNSGGTSANGAGTSSGGTRTSGGATGTGGATGIPGGKCADETVTCVDATHATGCNLDTGLVDTFSCVDELASLGVVSSGCTKDATGDYCAVDDLADQACADGAGAFAYCYNATTDEQFFNIYVSCFTNYMDGNTIIPCFTQYVTPEMKTAGDCANADAACFGDVVGAAGAGGSP
jgi:hypothetical protein